MAPRRPALLLLSVAVLATAAAPPPLLEIAPGETIPVIIEGETLRIAVKTSNLDKLVINASVIDRLGIKPATLMGKATVKIGPTTVLRGRNRPINHVVAGAASGDRVLWFEPASADAPTAESERISAPMAESARISAPMAESAGANTVDGSIGPWSIPHDRVGFRLPGQGKQRFAFPLFGTVDSLSFTRVVTPDYSFGLIFGVESPGRYPVASAAAGAAIASALGGVASTEAWEEEVLLGIRRPVRRVDLARPLVIGSWRFSTIAVRVRDARDGLGAGGAIPQAASDDADPAEITVNANAAKGPRPIYTLSIGASALAQCSRLEYAKAAHEIRLDC